MIFGRQSIVSGVEETDDRLLKVYLGQRGRNVYTLVEPGDEAEQVKRAWGDPSCHVFVPTPPDDCIYVEES